MSRKNLIVREKKNDKGEIFREFSLRDEHSYMIGLNNGIEKGKLEQKKEELRFLLNIQNWFDTATGQAYEVNERIKQLQKEIRGMK